MPRPIRPGRKVGSARDRSVRQAYDILRACIRRGLLGPDDPLVEYHLTRSLAIGRNAIRDALQALADDGLVTRRRGIGTLVGRQTIRVSSQEILSLGDSPEAGARVSIRRLASDIVEIGELLRERLEFTPGPLRMIELLVSVDGEPICVLDTYLPSDVDVSRFSERYESVSVSFEAMMGRPLGRTETTIEAINAEGWSAAVLSVEPGTALVLREQIFYDTQGNAALMNVARYRSDRVAFTNESANERL